MRTDTRRTGGTEASLTTASTTTRDRGSGRRTARAYVGLGANVGPAEATLARGVLALSRLPGVRLRGVSQLYATEPWGVVDQPEFRNAVVALDVPAGRDPTSGATDLLVALKDLERDFGRERRARWGPREIDLDLLVFGRARVSTSRPEAGRSGDPAKADLPLTVPHPLIGERLFVLQPLADLAPRLVPPGWSETVRAARDRRRRIDGPTAARPIAGWSAAAGTWRPLVGEEARVGDAPDDRSPTPHGAGPSRRR